MSNDTADPRSEEPAPAASGSLELLAPAGDWDALEAALQAGAGAVYFGLTTLNARRRARNFRQEEFARAVETVHAHGARAYLTLNIDLSERDLGQAARILELAQQCKADAVLVRDPALLALRVMYPELEFHFSTQTCMANRADVEAAGRLGASRVVLARELTLAEIAAASKVPGVQTEVFVQGALCFSVSGRCLLSSWTGGRSGNRGACTSPCRVPWTIGQRPAGTPLSMHDLSAIHRIADLQKAGVTGLKIEGRLKNADWVRQAVQLYRQAIALSDCSGQTESDQQVSKEELLRRAAELGAYTGRAMTCGYLDNQRNHLTGEAGRTAASTESPPDESAPPPADEADMDSDATGATYDFSITIEPRGIVCRCELAGRVVEWTVPKTVVRRAHKAMAVGHMLDLLTVTPILGIELRHASTNDPEFLMVPRACNALMDRIGAAIRLMRKAPDDHVRVSLRAEVQEILEKAEPHAMNQRKLGDPPNRVRLHVSAIGTLVRHVRPEALIVEGATADSLDRVLDAVDDVAVVVALPSVFFEDDTPRLRKLLQQCKAARVTVEVNSWGGWRLGQQAGVRMESGPGLPVLNSLAARVLHQAGIRCVTLSPEAGRRQLEELTAHCASPCSLVVFGRPPLLITRARLPEDSLDQVFEDRRGVCLVPRLEHGLTVFRPVEPFDLRDVQNPRIRVQHLVVDLVRSEDPVGDWHCLPDSEQNVFRFNYDRSLA